MPHGAYGLSIFTGDPAFREREREREPEHSTRSLGAIFRLVEHQD